MEGTLMMSALVVEQKTVENVENMEDMEQYLNSLVIEVSCVDYPSGKERRIIIYGRGIVKDGEDMLKISQSEVESIFDRASSLRKYSQNNWRKMLSSPSYRFPSTHGYEEFSVKVIGKEYDPFEVNFTSLDIYRNPDCKEFIEVVEEFNQ